MDLFDWEQREVLFIGEFYYVKQPNATLVTSKRYLYILCFSIFDCYMPCLVAYYKNGSHHHTHRLYQWSDDRSCSWRNSSGFAAINHCYHSGHFTNEEGKKV